MEEILKKFLKEKCIFIEESDKEDQNIYTYHNGLVSFQIEGKKYVTYEKEEALLLLQLYGLKKYSEGKPLTKEEKIEFTLKRCEELEKDKELMELIRSIQPPLEEIQKKKEYNRKRQKI